MHFVANSQLFEMMIFVGGDRHLRQNSNFPLQNHQQTAHHLILHIVLKVIKQNKGAMKA